MKIREAIKLLQTIEQEHGGDLEICAVAEVDEFFSIDKNVVFDVIEVPDEDGSNFEKVCALMEPLDETAGRPFLKEVKSEQIN